MFEVNDKVVLNGFRVRGESHQYGTNSHMERWESNKTVVTVTRIGQERSMMVHVADSDGNTAGMSKEELRYATDNEQRAARGTLKTVPKGSLVKVKEGTIYKVIRGSFDIDGEIRVSPVNMSESTTRYVKYEDIAEVYLASPDYFTASSSSESAVGKTGKVISERAYYPLNHTSVILREHENTYAMYDEDGDVLTISKSCVEVLP